MAQTKLNPADQLPAGSITRSMLNTTTGGSALITRVLAGSGISLSSTGVDAGTGDVTVSLGALTSFGVGSGGNGSVALQQGSGSNPGYVAFKDDAGTRVGYVGWQGSTNYLALETEGGYLGYIMSGNLITSGRHGIGTVNLDEVLSVTGAIRINAAAPDSTRNALYNVGGTLYWNGSALGSGGGSGLSVASIAFDFGSTPVCAKKFTFAPTCVSGQKIVMWPDPDALSGGMDELEMDALVCFADVTGNNAATALITAIPGPIVGSRNFYYMVI